MRFSVAVPRSKRDLASSMLRKYRRLRRPGGLRREYKKLRSLLPGATRSHHLRKKVGVVEAAYQYICELQTALLDKFSTKGVPEDLADVVRGKVVTASDIQALALHLINNSPVNSNNNNIFMRSNYSTVPSFPSPSSVTTQLQESSRSALPREETVESELSSSPVTQISIASSLKSEAISFPHSNSTSSSVDSVCSHQSLPVGSEVQEDSHPHSSTVPTGQVSSGASQSPSEQISKDEIPLTSSSRRPSSPSLSSSESQMSTEES